LVEQLAFNQWVAGSSPARLIQKDNGINNLRAASDSRSTCFYQVLLQFVALF